MTAEYFLSRAPKEASNNTSKIYLAFFVFGFPRATLAARGICRTFIIPEALVSFLNFKLRSSFLFKNLK